MSVHVIDNLRQPVVPLGTSGDGVLEWARDWVIRIGTLVGVAVPVFWLGMGLQVLFGIKFKEWGLKPAGL